MGRGVPPLPVQYVPSWPGQVQLNRFYFCIISYRHLYFQVTRVIVIETQEE